MDFNMDDSQQRAARLAAMYLDDEPTAVAPHPAAPAAARSRKIRVGVVEYEVPTVAYVEQLEQLLVRQRQSIEQFQLLIERLVNSLMRARTSQTKFERELLDLRRELGKKITARDFA
jgi:hypothetical protein